MGRFEFFLHFGHSIRTQLQRNGSLWRSGYISDFRTARAKLAIIIKLHLQGMLCWNLSYKVPLTQLSMPPNPYSFLLLSITFVLLSYVGGPLGSGFENLLIWSYRQSARLRSDGRTFKSFERQIWQWGAKFIGWRKPCRHHSGPKGDVQLSNGRSSH